jgi:hypothetical protein
VQPDPLSFLGYSGDEHEEPDTWSRVKGGLDSAFSHVPGVLDAVATTVPDPKPAPTDYKPLLLWGGLAALALAGVVFLVRKV